MRDPRLGKLADVVVLYSTRVKKGDLVTIVGDTDCMAAVEAIFESTLRAGGHPSFHPKCDSLHEIVLRHGNSEQITHVSPFEEHRLANCDVLIVLYYSRNTKYLGRVDPAKIASAQSARRELFALSTRREAAGKLRYCLVEIPGHAAAQNAEMSLTDYEEWVYRAGFLHMADPVGQWRKLHEQQQRVCEYLGSRSALRFTAPACDGAGGARRHDGTDLTVNVSGRKWISCAGASNFPDGEVYTGPRGVEGVVNFTFTANYRGVDVEGVRLKFKAGRVVEASASKNEEYLVKMLDLDEGARGVGEIAIGTNYQLDETSRNTFFDEKIGGTFHLAVGGGFPETGNTNESGIHWDMVCDLRPGKAFAGSAGGLIEADGVVIQRDGRFLMEGWPG